MALPALSCMMRCTALAAHDVAGHANVSRDHPIAEIRLVVDEAFDPLRKHLVDDRVRSWRR